ncbi:universal stress protein [Halorubrum halophilum]|uniref:universal stress protein n=1 Tax=Halorubrum halophilum TaxID=413816 RepID=UPI00186B00AE|nr:universal stress protein [Halorubrum halophilum]
MAGTDATDPNGDRNLLAHALLPVANESDALATARALEPYDPERVTALHVVEKGDGVADKTPVEQSEDLAAESYAAVRTVFPDAEEHTAYSRDVVDAIVAAADEVGASAIAYRSRGGNRLMQFLSGDLSVQLVTDAPIPVVALPRAADEDEEEAEAVDGEAADADEGGDA